MQTQLTGIKKSIVRVTLGDLAIGLWCRQAPMMQVEGEHVCFDFVRHCTFTYREIKVTLSSRRALAELTHRQRSGMDQRCLWQPERIRGHVDTYIC